MLRLQRLKGHYPGWLIRTCNNLLEPHSVSLKRFLARAQQTGAFNDVETLTIETLRQALHTRVDEVDFEQAKAGVKPFLSNVDGLKIWSANYFHQLVNKVVGVDGL